VVSLSVNEDGSYTFLREVEGDSVEDVLSIVEYDRRALKNRLKNITEDSIHKGYISVAERRIIFRTFEEGLRGYTYFERE
jgi:arginine decarboxylase